MRRLPALAALLILAGCAAPRPAPRRSAPVRPAPPRAIRAARLGFTIQAGAFAKVENAARLSETLQARGLDATYFAAGGGLFKVRFGDFATKAEARTRAEALRAAGVIQDFYLVAPEEPALPRPVPTDERGLRSNLVETARSYLGVPYLWGGTSARGFDCSGLAWAVYRLNGLALPRSSRDQFEAGSPVQLEKARPGDLVFFATRRGPGVSHVGILLGGGLFIHAPSPGRTISRDRLDDPYYRNRLVGVRSFLG